MRDGIYGWRVVQICCVLGATGSVGLAVADAVRAGPSAYAALLFASGVAWGTGRVSRLAPLAVGTMCSSVATLIAMDSAAPATLMLWAAGVSLLGLLRIIQCQSPQLAEVHQTTRRGGGHPRTKQAVLLYYSLTGNARRAMGAVRSGLEERGYRVDECAVVAKDRIYTWPFRGLDWYRAVLRAARRSSTTIEPLGLAADHSYDLIVCGGQTWLGGIPAPYEAAFEDPANALVFRDRDVAIVTVCRGQWRRSHAMTAAWVERLGARIVGMNFQTNSGAEPMRIVSLFTFFVTGKEGVPRWLEGWFLKPQLLGPGAVEALRQFGRALAEREPT